MYASRKLHEFHSGNNSTEVTRIANSHEQTSCLKGSCGVQNQSTIFKSGKRTSRTKKRRIRPMPPPGGKAIGPIGQAS
jgi:hypothetical protein